MVHTGLVCTQVLLGPSFQRVRNLGQRGKHDNGVSQNARPVKVPGAEEGQGPFPEVQKMEQGLRPRPRARTKPGEDLGSSQEGPGLRVAPRKQPAPPSGAHVWSGQGAQVLATAEVAGEGLQSL